MCIFRQRRRESSEKGSLNRRRGSPRNWPELIMKNSEMKRWGSTLRRTGRLYFIINHHMMFSCIYTVRFIYWQYWASRARVKAQVGLHEQRAGSTDSWKGGHAIWNIGECELQLCHIFGHVSCDFSDCAFTFFQRQEAAIARKIKEELERAEMENEKQEQKRHEEVVRYQQDLEQQLEEKERKRQEAYEEFIKEKLVVDEIVRKIYEEDQMWVFFLSSCSFFTGLFVTLPLKTQLKSFMWFPVFYFLHNVKNNLLNIDLIS